MKKRFTPYLTLVGLFIILTMLASCGYRQTIRSACRLGTQMCDTLFGQDEYTRDRQLEANTKSIQDLEKQIQSLKTILDQGIFELGLYEQQIATNTALLTLLQLSASNNAETIEQLKAQIETLQDKVNYQQVVLTDLEIQIANLASDDTIVEYVDPCDNGPGFDEVLLRTKSGKYIAYFEETGSSKRFLTILQRNITYRTSDTQKCYFTIDNDGQLTQEHL